MIDINIGSFTNPGGGVVFPSVLVQYRGNALILECTCNQTGNKLCDHQAQVLYNIMERPDLRIFFDNKMRYEKIRTVAESYGLENLANPDEYFELTWVNRLVSISPRMKSLMPVNESALQQLSAELLPQSELPLLGSAKQDSTLLLLFSQHKYYQHLQVSLYEATTGLNGK